MGHTKHSACRAQQRGIPPVVVRLVQEFGRKSYDHNGAVVRYLDKQARRAIECKVGRSLMRRFNEFSDIYVVEAVGSGEILTVGHRYSRINRN